MGLIIGEGVAIFDPDQQSRNDFMWMTMILLLGFSLIALAATLFVEKKINNKLFSIKNSLLYLTKDNYFADKYLAKQKSIQEPFVEITNLLSQMREYFVEYEESINKKYQTLNQREKMRALDHLSTSIAHEINNPLAGILGHAQLAKGKSVDLPLQKHLDVIEKEIRKVKDFTRDLMRFSKNIPLDYKSLNINQVILETIDLMETQLRSKNIQIQKRLTSIQEVHIDALQLQQVFLNLINNAIYAMERSQERTLTIHTEDLKNSARIQVSDTGVGIPTNIKDKIFEPFFTTKKIPQEGKGLGLSVCFGIIKGHKGNIHVESEVNKGSTFIIDLPYPENLQNQQKFDTQDFTSSEVPIKSQQNSIEIDKPVSSPIVNRPMSQKNQVEDSTPTEVPMFGKETLVDIKNPFREQKKDDSVTLSDLQDKLKASNQIPKVKSSQIDESESISSSHEPVSPSFQTDQIISKENDITKVQFDQAKSKQEIGIQLNESLTEKESTPEKLNFSINKHAIVNKKRLEFKVKIRPPKIKEK